MYAVLFRFVLIDLIISTTDTETGTGLLSRLATADIVDTEEQACGLEIQSV